MSTEYTIAGHKLSIHNTGHFGRLIYIDNILASNDRDVRPDKDLKFWKQFLSDNLDFDAKCLLPKAPPWSTTRETFEEIYE